MGSGVARSQIIAGTFTPTSSWDGSRSLAPSAGGKWGGDGRARLKGRYPTSEPGNRISDTCSQGFRRGGGG